MRDHLPEDRARDDIARRQLEPQVLELGAQPERTLFLLRVFDVGVPLLTSALAIVIMLTYPISEDRAYEIRAELERRRGKLGSEATPA